MDFEMSSSKSPDVAILDPTPVQKHFSPLTGTALPQDDAETHSIHKHKRSLWLRFVAFPYYGPLHYYTIDPMTKICEKQDDLNMTIKLLCLFKSRKHEEITFIRVASSLSAAASIGTLSWSNITTALWAVQYFLTISLYMSAFALVSTAALRQLDYFPNTTTAIFTEREVHAMLSLLLDFPKEVDPKPQRPGILRRTTDSTLVTDCEAGAPDKMYRLRGVPSRYKQYFWQVSMMLMSGSWLTYLVGVTLYMMTPLVQAKTWSADAVASAVTFLFAMVISANFLFTNNRAFALLDAAKQKGLREDNELVSREQEW